MQHAPQYFPFECVVFSLLFSISLVEPIKSGSWHDPWRLATGEGAASLLRPQMPDVKKEKSYEPHYCVSNHLFVDAGQPAAGQGAKKYERGRCRATSRELFG